MKQYIGISRDHTGSMQSMTRAAMDDYNKTIAALKESGSAYGIETILSVVNCGTGRYGTVSRDIENKDILRVLPLTSYPAQANSTPLWDSVMELINMFKAHPDYNNPEASFLIMAITDGGDNSSRVSPITLAAEINSLIRTDRWTFVFRVPRGYGKNIARIGVPEGNIQEWDTTSKGMETATTQTTQSVSNFYQARSTGVKSTGTFFVNPGYVAKEQITRKLVDISRKVQPYSVVHSGEEIRPFMTRVRGNYEIGTAYYQLTKSELVQANKRLLVLDTTTGHVYGGADARASLGLPEGSNLQLRPGNLGNFKVFIQSTSVNRKLVGGTLVYYWNGNF